MKGEVQCVIYSVSESKSWWMEKSIVSLIVCQSWKLDEGRSPVCWSQRILHETLIVCQSENVYTGTIISPEFVMKYRYQI